MRVRKHLAAAPAQVAMPSRHVLVGQARRDIKHDDCALAVDVVPIAQPAKLLLPSGVPAIEAQLAAVGGEVQRVHLHADRGCMPRTHALAMRSAGGS